MEPRNDNRPSGTPKPVALCGRKRRRWEGTRKGEAYARAQHNVDKETRIMRLTVKRTVSNGLRKERGGGREDGDEGGGRPRQHAVGSLPKKHERKCRHGARKNRGETCHISDVKQKSRRQKDCAPRRCQQIWKGSLRDEMPGTHFASESGHPKDAEETRPSVTA